jgi:sugar/nucleoside kinase (ribokinase family)
MSKKILTIGGVYLDINATDFPIGDEGLQPETELVGNHYITELGGAAVNFARIAETLDLRTSFIGKVGKDEFGKVIAKLMEAVGIDSRLVVDELTSTNISFNMANSHGQTAMAVVGNANQSLRPEEVIGETLEFMDQYDYIMIGGCFKLRQLMPAFFNIVDHAKVSGTKIVLDHGRINSHVTEADKQRVRELVAKVDYYLPSRDEFMQLWKANSIEEGLRTVSQRTDATIVVKDGKNGAVTLIYDKAVRVPTFSVQPIHTVGAGDSFNAGLIAALAENAELTEAIRYANAVAALRISSDSPPTRDAVTTFLESHS